MVKRSHGFRAKSRQKLCGGRFSIAEAMQDFKKGEKVRIKINPAVHSGMPHPRYQNAYGIVKEKRGRSFLLEIKDREKTKEVIARPEHLAPA